MGFIGPDTLPLGNGTTCQHISPKIAYLGSLSTELRKRLDKRFGSLNIVHYETASESQFFDDLQDPDSALSGVSAILRLGTEASTKLPQGWTTNMLRLAALPNSLRLLVNLGHGLEKEDVSGAAAKGITVAGTGGGTDATATVALYLVISVFRNLSAAERSARTGDRDSFVSSMYRASALSRDPQGKSVCILGYGRIGQRIGQLLGALGMKICAVRRSRSGSQGGPVTLENGVTVYDSLGDIISEVDCVVLACPYTKETHHVMDWAMITRMKPGARVINVARGKCIDEEALVKGLEKGILGGVGLDVYENE